MDVRLSYSHHLVGLLTEAAMAAGRLVDLPDELQATLIDAARRDAAWHSARLDGSPLDASTAEAVNAGTWRRPRGLDARETVRGWASALRLDGMATQDVAALEYDNLLAAYDAEEHLAATFFEQPLSALAELHGIVGAELVDPQTVGVPRCTDRAVHDGAQGMVIYNTPPAGAIPELLAGLEAWLRGESGGEGSAELSTPVVAAIVHERLLQWQPYEAANGRVARSAARVVVRARGMDPHGLAVAERVWSADPAGYYGEVAATIRRRDDLSVWVERHTEALVEALLASVRVAHPETTEPAGPGRDAIAALRPGEAITVAEYAQRAGLGRETAWRDLRTLMVQGHVVRESRSLGRRFRRL